MAFTTSSIALFAALAASTISSGFSQDCGATWTCRPTTTAPTLDADHSEWADVKGIATDMLMITGEEYAGGQASYKCMYDDEKIYFALEIPGEYRFNATDNKQCAAIATMMKIGPDASYINMGACPDAFAGCADGVPASCDSYRVDIGAHWELSGTEQGVEYGVSIADVEGVTTRSGNDLIANKDDEYAVSPYCRFDDDDAAAGNEWAGAWLHTNPVDGEFGTYKYELSRLLTTESTTTDGQFVAGQTFEFGVALWDPFQTEAGWTEIGHYVTGCGTKWINLELAVDDAGGASGAGGGSSLFVVLAAATSAVVTALW